jgi:hypothetical protein
MYIRQKLFLISFFILITFHSYSQEEEEINVVGFRFLKYGKELPKDLLEAKSLVLVSVPPVSKNSSIRGDWKAFASESHEYFKKIGIDAVAYAYLNDVFANQEVSKAYADIFTKREIKYIIVLSKVWLKIKNKESLRYVIVITPYSRDALFIANGQNAYKDQNKDLEKAMKKIYGVSVRKDMVKSNNLIIDQPEFLPAFTIIKGLKYQSFPQDLRVDKLAVPKFEEAPIPSKRPGGILNNRIAKEIEKANTAVERQNFELDRLFQNYPWKYELVDLKKGEEQLYRDGFLYRLVRIQSNGRMVKEFLDYETNDMETDYVTLKKKPNGTITLRTIPADAPIHKFYIKNLARNEVYVGDSWDADETWQEALTNFLDNLIEKLKK